ncbi:hypothetical protein FZEAL_1722 [Fusarium zealandicum]|uniref:Uncharacterized protein n=1 Tax=Fusarium zealandicum TaxID=1053134 RepID=A0A8H4XPM2_9HYPO|nr:hypothetical protein FZEAL_1722 [Fusarium zealandicum]
MNMLNGNHRSQAQFDRAKWRLKVLLPTWVVQLVLTTAMMGLFAWRLGDTMKEYRDDDKSNDDPMIELVWEATNVALWFVASLCTFVEVAKFFAESLTPWTMLFTHVIKLTCAISTLALDIVVYVQHHDKHYSLVALGLDVVFILISLVLVFYSIRVYRRLSAYDDYSHPVNVKPFGFHDDLERDTSYPSTVGGPRQSTDKRFSSVSSRLSFSSSKTDPVELGKLERTPSVYSHKRDTQFDDFVARRGSVHKTDRTLSGDFSRSASAADLQDSASTPTRPRGHSTGRATSWASERGLVAVPEEDDDENHGNQSKGKMDRQSLLGDTPRESVDGPLVPQEVDLAEPRWQRE